MSLSSAKVRACSMAMRVSRKLGIPLKSGVAAKCLRMCRMPRNSSMRLMLSLIWRRNRAIFSLLEMCGTSPVSIYCFISLKIHGAPIEGSAHHNAVHAVAVVVFFQFLGRSDVAVADNGDVHTGVVLHLANQRPVGFTGVHLTTGAPMDGEGSNTAILQLLCHFHNVLGVAVPTRAAFLRSQAHSQH